MNLPDAPEGTPLPPAQSVPKERNAQWKILLCGALWSVIFYLFMCRFVLMGVEIKGASMSPTLLDGDRYILYRCPYLWRSPREGEIVVIKDPQDLDLSIKRIIGLPNDLVEIRSDGVYVNKIRLPEPYLTSHAARAGIITPVKPVRLGQHEYFVLGDNRTLSADSRIYGPVPRKFILGLISKS